jgi:hypothetical protein
MAFLFSVVLVSILSACGGSTVGVQNINNNRGTAAAVSIAYQPAPPTTLFVNAQAQLTAVVSDDSNNYGVDWCVSAPGYQCGGPLICPSNVCGSLSPLHTSSGGTVNYAPPPSITGNSEAIDIVAFATADHTKNVAAPIAITGFDGNLKGTYVFQVKGSNTDSLAPASVQGSYEIAGVINLDGNGGFNKIEVNGKMVAGEQTFNDSSRSGTAYITGGNYFLGSDRRGTLTLETNDPTLGVKGVETFTLAFLSSSQVLMAEVESNGSASAAGTMDLQTSTAMPTGGYAFVASGTDGAGVPIAAGGVFNVDQSNGTISGKGSVADVDYGGHVQNCPAPVKSTDPSGLSGSVLAPDQFGAAQITLQACFSSSPIQFTGYLVDATHMKLIETDLNSKAGTGFATGGAAIGQGASTGALAGAQAFLGTYVFGILGMDSSQLASSLNSVGLVTSQGAGVLNGTNDEVMSIGNVISDSFSGSYTVDSSGSGRVVAPITYQNSSNAALSAPELIFYLTGQGTTALVLDFDTATASGAVGAGIAYPQAASQLAFNGKFGFSGWNLNESLDVWTEDDASGVMTVDPTTNTLAGYVDGLLLYPSDESLTGSFLTPPANGRFSGQLSAPDTALPNPAVTEFYLVDSEHGFFVETDLANSTFLGYFAASTPVCPNCQ